METILKISHPILNCSELYNENKLFYLLSDGKLLNTRVNYLQIDIEFKIGNTIKTFYSSENNVCIKV